MKVAAIDLGTNSYLCLIAEVDANRLSVIEDHCEIIRLGENVQTTGVFSEEALKRSDACLKKFKSRIDFHKVKNVAAVATSAARDVKNGNRLLEIGEKYQIPMHIIAGPKEAELTYLGALTGENKNKNFVVVDIGGGSTEFAYAENKQTKFKSYNVGCVRLTEKFLSVDKNSSKNLAEFEKYLDSQLAELSIPSQINEIVAVAGTPTTLSAMKFKKPFSYELIENSELTVEDLNKIIDQVASLNLEERKKLAGLEPKRADVILAGALILRNIIKKMGFSKVRVSTRGVRYGLALLIASGESIT